MCGITGFNWDDKELIKEMTNSLIHRGPDAEGHFSDKNISLGHRRLAIIDLSVSGNQPMFNENGDIVIVFNGEIYNFKNIKKKLKSHQFNSNTDTEVLVHLYEELGEKMLQKIEGDFAFCIYDSKLKKLFLARDRMGVKPLYYYFDGTKFIFASEIKSILKCKDIKKSINKIALNKFISLRYIPGKETIFQNIFRMLPGEYLIFDLKNNGLEEYFYWDIETHYLSTKHPIEYYEKNIYNLLKTSVSKRLMSDVPLGVYLSGGIDSSAIVGMMNELGQKEIKTFSVAFKYGEDVNELPYAKQIAEKFKTDHTEFYIEPDIVHELPKMLYHLDEPIADPAIIPVNLMSKKAKKHITVVLTGEGGDELFGGYDQYRLLNTGNILSKIPFTDHLSKIMNLVPKSLLNKYYKYSSKMGPDSFKRVDNMINSFKHKNYAKAYYELMSVFNDDERKNLLIKDSFEEIDYMDLNQTFFSSKMSYLNKLMYFEAKNQMCESFLMKADKMTMAYAIEGRVPFLDHNLVDFAFKIPSNLKVHRGITKYILKKSLRRLLPKEILKRKKQGFIVPIENWIQKDLKESVDQLLDKKEIDKMKLFNYKEVNKIFKNYNKGKLFYGRQAWNLLCFKLWYDQYFFDGPGGN